MWFIKIISVLTQICIIILAVLLVLQFSFRQVSDNRLTNLETKLSYTIEDNKKYLNDKIVTLADNLNSYQNHREVRAQYFSQRLDALEKYCSISPKISGTGLLLNNTKSEEQEEVDLKKIVEGNLSYSESRINKVNSALDDVSNDLRSRLGVLEAKVKVLENENKTLKTEAKVINNNNAVVNMPATLQTLR